MVGEASTQPSTPSGSQSRTPISTACFNRRVGRWRAVMVVVLEEFCPATA
ncbi:MAG: hypothetical protein ACO2O2_04965 [Acidilobaceae archaeon]